MAVNYHGILTLEKSSVKITPVIYRIYNIDPRG
jgi:hypothetical protein